MGKKDNGEKEMSEIDEYYYLQYAMIEERGKENPQIVKSFNELRQKLDSALKLQELVKNKIEHVILTHENQKWDLLQSLVDQSENA